MDSYAPLVNESDTRSLWITGAGGLIGNCLADQSALHSRIWRTHAWTRADLDLTDHQAVDNAYKKTRPSLIIHCAAISKSTACDANPPMARQVNVESTRVLCEIAGETPVWFLSTDLVFDGKSGGYAENAAVNPLTFYGQTKVEAERHVLRHPRNAVFRLSLNGGRSPTGDRGFNEEFRRSVESGKTMNLFVDEFRCPASADMTATALWKLAALDQLPHGIFHLCGGDRLSRYQIGRLLLRRWGLDESILQSGSILGYQGPPRSPDTSMTCARVETLLNNPMPGLKAWLDGNPEAPF